MIPARPRPLAEVLASTTRNCRDMASLADAVFRAVRLAVPYDFACLATADPSTGLISSAFKSRALEVGDEEFAAAEYAYADINQFADIVRRADPVAVLSVDTGGRPDDCRRFREFLRPRFGFTDELRVVLRAAGLTWGMLALYRGPGDPPFTPADGRILSAAHGAVADLIRRTVFGAPPTAANPADGPSVIVVDDADQVTDITAAARVHVDDLGGWDHGSLPACVLATVEAARRTPELAMTRVAARSGGWLVVRASTFGPAAASGERTPHTAVVTITAATAADTSAMALAARGLSPREQDVAGYVLQGAATSAIAGALHLSPHTVQDHLKSIFVKLGVNSRREMVRQLVLS
ncbi:helix-turn-helix domain-containing protein [Nakamurella endophytica]|uniref:Helix-turn-helix transcriptional regulator n=1 Tax=Nakamurella endophytica TaxID=1748367 RepID=A0A917TE83_9ACTN|nr:helix-turn-helix transcriptional regulator [Nakamurella endophytica]GGM17408.1 helix-turn-helix transcriptional regulator [Nakamurella endophytica]